MYVDTYELIQKTNSEIVVKDSNNIFEYNWLQNTIFNNKDQMDLCKLNKHTVLYLCIKNLYVPVN